MLYPKYALCSLVFLLLHLECDPRFSWPGVCPWAWICFVPRALCVTSCSPAGTGTAACAAESARGNSPVLIYPLVLSAGMLALLFGVFHVNVLWEEFVMSLSCCADLRWKSKNGIIFFFLFVCFWVR